MNASKPTVHCLAAYLYEDGKFLGRVHRVTLETAEWMKALGYVIVGPDPEDMQDLATWERNQYGQSRNG